MAIKNIIFDLGGVLLNIDYRLTSQAFVDLGLTNFDEHYSQMKQERIFDLLETGKISPDEFRKGLLPFLPANTSFEQIDNAWNAMLLDFPKERVSLLESTSKNYRCFLLSNTNIIHYEQYEHYLQDLFGKNPLHQHLEKVYYSHEIKLRKPDEECFQFVLNDTGIKANETLFIDDTQQHIIGAKASGIKAHHLNLQKENVLNLFDKNGMLLPDFLAQFD